MQDKLTLDTLMEGQVAKVTSLVMRNKLLFSRLLSMGLTAGTDIKLSRKAPLGDPIEIEARGYHLSLRLSEARTIEIEVVPPGA